MNRVMTRAVARQAIANRILTELDLVNRWSQFGDCKIVGSVVYHLVVAPDIDLEVWCAEPRVDDGFEVLRACAHHPNVKRARFWKYRLL